MWHESEHRLLLLQSELRVAQVTQRAVAADLRHTEAACASQASRINELTSTAALEHQASRKRVEALEAAREDARRARIESAELTLQLVAAGAMSQALRGEIGLLEKAVEDGEAEARSMLTKVHASAVERAGQHRKQIELWEKRASGLIDAGPAAKLDLILMHGNADLFEQVGAMGTPP